MLIDQHHRPIHDLRISVTDRCNFRCGYCMPKDKFGRDHQFLKRSALLSFEEIEQIARAFVALGVTKIRLTGGEPLLRRDLETLIKKLVCIKGLEDLSLTSNASLLNAKRAKSLKAAGIGRINISLDAIDEKTFAKLNGVNFQVSDVLAGINHALNAGFEAVKINMVVQKGVNEDAILPMVEHFIGRGVILRFIEFMDVGNANHWQAQSVFSAKEILSLVQSRYSLKPLDQNYRGEVAKRWRLNQAGNDEGLEIGIISSVSEPFCGECSRARLSAIGEIYTCLFASKGFDLRKVLRESDNAGAVSDAIQTLWHKRDDRYSELRSNQHASGSQAQQKVEMSYIGG